MKNVKRTSSTATKRARTTNSKMETSSRVGKTARTKNTRKTAKAKNCSK